MTGERADIIERIQSTQCCDGQIDALLSGAAREIASLRDERDALMSESARMRAALAPLAGMPLWRDTYPDGPDILDSDTALRHYFSPDHVRAARALVAADASEPPRQEKV